MPGINVIVSGHPNAALTRQLVEQLTQLTCDVLKKERSRTRVIVQYLSLIHI